MCVVVARMRKRRTHFEVDGSLGFDPVCFQNEWT
jgi:hypothetical protein